MTDIVLVDDDPDIRMLVRMALELDGHRVVAAANGHEGLEFLRASVAAGDRPVVVLDVQMPDIDGWEVLGTIRSDAELHAVPVIMCTVRAGAMDRARGYAGGADAYEAKPFDLDQLQTTVRRLAAMEPEALIARRADLASEPTAD
jgi:two-component system response regulator MprA